MNRPGLEPGPDQLGYGAVVGSNASWRLATLVASNHGHPGKHESEVR